MSLVTLHVYDITNTTYETANNVIQGLNRFTKDALGAGGIFHGAVEVNGDEWSYGFCERGSGVYCCHPRGNTGYTYRESVPLGVTSLSPARVRSVIAVLQAQWPGCEYDLLGKNCNHFCEAFGAMLGVPGPPAWVNRFATQAEATVKTVNYALEQISLIGGEIGSAATAAADWLAGAFSGGAGGGDRNGNAAGGAAGTNAFRSPRSGEGAA